MANEEQTDKSPAELADRVWELAEKIDFCMFTTSDDTQQWARPLSSRVHRDEDAIYFLVDANGRKNAQIDENANVTLAYADAGSNKYVTINGTAVVANDRALITRLWSDFDKAWWDGADDPNIRVVTVTPEQAELWDSPNKLVATASMLAAALTGGKPKFGDHAQVNV